LRTVELLASAPARQPIHDQGHSCHEDKDDQHGGQPGQDGCGGVSIVCAWSVAACLARALVGFLQRLLPLLGLIERLLHVVVALWNSWLSR
jgi:hypothetical protein